MRWRVIVLTDEHEKLLKALDKAGIGYELCSIATATDRRPLTAEEAQRVYDSYASGLSARAVSERFGVSLPTVQRVAGNPQGYGLKAKPVRRVIRGRST